MAGLKGNLGEARRLLAARHKQLQQQWYRSITLRHVIQLLDQIDSVAKVPARIERLMLERKHYAAVQLLLQSSSMLEREGIQGVTFWTAMCLLSALASGSVLSSWCMHMWRITGSRLGTFEKLDILKDSNLES
jgi:hypothetical protein